MNERTPESFEAEKEFYSKYDAYHAQEQKIMDLMHNATDKASQVEYAKQLLELTRNHRESIQPLLAKMAG